MKNLFFAIMLFSMACSPSRPTADDYRGKASGLVSFRVWNNSLLPHQYTIIGYNPGENGNGSWASNWTNGLFLLPGTSHRYSCPVGTKIYRANRRQVGTVMGGGSIREEDPFIVLKKEDAGRSFRLNR